jgi:hypothetical protein
MKGLPASCRQGPPAPPHARRRRAVRAALRAGPGAPRPSARLLPPRAACGSAAWAVGPMRAAAGRAPRRSSAAHGQPAARSAMGPCGLSPSLRPSSRSTASATCPGRGRARLPVRRAPARGAPVLAARMRHCLSRAARMRRCRSPGGRQEAGRRAPRERPAPEAAPGQRTCGRPSAERARRSRRAVGRLTRPRTTCAGTLLAS